MPSVCNVNSWILKRVNETIEGLDHQAFAVMDRYMMFGRSGAGNGRIQKT